MIFNAKITSVINKENSVFLSDEKNEWGSELIYNCAVLFSDRNYHHFNNIKKSLRIVRFRGEYLMLKSEAGKLVNHLIYPVPYPKYPFLGVQYTRLINSEREVGLMLFLQLNEKAIRIKAFH